MKQWFYEYSNNNIYIRGDTRRAWTAGCNTRQNYIWGMAGNNTLLLSALGLATVQEIVIVGLKIPIKQKAHPFHMKPFSLYTVSSFSPYLENHYVVYVPLNSLLRPISILR